MNIKLGELYLFNNSLVKEKFNYEIVYITDIVLSRNRHIIAFEYLNYMDSEKHKLTEDVFIERTIEYKLVENINRI